MKIKTCIILLVPFIFCSKALSQGEPLQLRAVIHLSSVISEGSYDLSRIAELARYTGVSVVALTDRDLMEWEYGVWPLRNVFKKTVRQASIFTYQLKRYLAKIEEVQKKFPELVFIPGVESAPFYYWQGSAVNSLKMHNWHRHILSLGLGKYSDYLNLPVIGNPRGLRRGFNLAAFWPVAVLIFSLWLGFNKTNIFKWQKIIAAALFAVSLLFIFNNCPFRKLKYDQYHDAGSSPYQNYIDYINEKGGLVFWAHPEAENKQHLAGIKFITPEHSSILEQTENYSGFCVFPSSRQIARPKGLWDKILKEYCLGVRRKPAWAIAALAFEKGDLTRIMRERQTVVIAAEKTREAVLDALREGRMYSLEGRRCSEFTLGEFFVTDKSGLIKAVSGGTARLEGDPQIHISGRFSEKQQQVEIRLIRDGQVFKRYIQQTPFNIVLEDSDAPKNKGEKFYYRLQVSGSGLLALSNPVFVER